MANLNQIDIADVLDDLSREFVQLADRMWGEGRKRRDNDQLTRREYDVVKAQCRALLRRAVEIVTTASHVRLRRLRGSSQELRRITATLKRARTRIERTQRIVEASIAAVAAVALIVAAVTAPSPATIAGAVAGVADFAGAAASAADDG